MALFVNPKTDEPTKGEPRSPSVMVTATPSLSRAPSPLPKTAATNKKQASNNTHLDVRASRVRRQRVQLPEVFQCVQLKKKTLTELETFPDLQHK